jgi:sterol 3beta-glucosyltransferase
MTRCVVDAVVESDVCAILSKGWSDRGSKSKDDEEDGDEKEKGGDDDKDDKDGKDGKQGADGIEYPDSIL